MKNTHVLPELMMDFLILALSQGLGPGVHFGEDFLKHSLDYFQIPGLEKGWCHFGQLLFGCHQLLFLEVLVEQSGERPELETGSELVQVQVFLLGSKNLNYSEIQSDLIYNLSVFIYFILFY